MISTPSVRGSHLALLYLSRLDGLSARSAKAEGDEGEEGLAPAAAAAVSFSSGMTGSELPEGEGAALETEAALASSLWPERRWRKARAPPVVRLCKQKEGYEQNMDLNQRDRAL